MNAGVVFVFVPEDAVESKLRAAAKLADELDVSSEWWPAVFTAAANAYMLGTFVPTGPATLPPEVARLLRTNGPGA